MINGYIFQQQPVRTCQMVWNCGSSVEAIDTNVPPFDADFKTPCLYASFHSSLHPTQSMTTSNGSSLYSSSSHLANRSHTAVGGSRFKRGGSTYFALYSSSSHLANHSHTVGGLDFNREGCA